MSHQFTGGGAPRAWVTGGTGASCRLTLQSELGPSSFRVS